MDIASLLPADQVLCDAEAKSRKRALELLAELLAKSAPSLSEEAIFDGLLARERLGSTGLGRGIAIPHTRLAGLGAPTLAVLKLPRDAAIDFDAPDGEPVDVMFALAVPDDDTEAPLRILSMLAEMLGQKKFVEGLRNTLNSKALHRQLLQWRPQTNDAPATTSATR